MNDSTPVAQQEFNFEQLVAALFAARGITEGLWRVAVKLHFAASTGEWVNDGLKSSLPTGLLGVAGIALISAKEPGPLIYDAAAFGATKVASPSKAVTRKVGKKKP